MLDIIIIVFIAAFVFSGYKKGLILALYGFVSFILAIILTRLFYPTAALYLRENTGLYDYFKEQAANFLSANTPNTDAVLSNADFINALNLPKALLNQAINADNPAVYGLLNVSGVYDYVCGFVANAIVNAIAVFVTFLLVTLLLRAVGQVLKIASHLPIIHTANKIGGAGLGLVTGVVLAWIIFSLVTVFFSANPTFNDMLTNSRIAAFLGANNSMAGWTTKIIK
ncbi:hypothetical protein FACS189490_14070 [Clostridia bacterium]|nr:hypothetical protein FACS189490_14070 [Clostridia bacterium]